MWFIFEFEIILILFCFVKLDRIYSFILDVLLIQKIQKENNCE